MPTIKTYYIEDCSEFTEDTKSIVIRTKDIKQVTRSNGLLTVYYDKVNTSHHRQQSEQGIITLKGDSASELFGTMFIEFKLNDRIRKQTVEDVTPSVYSCIERALRYETGCFLSWEMLDEAISQIQFKGECVTEKSVVEMIESIYKLKKQKEYQW